MEETLKLKAAPLASESATQAKPLDDVNELFRTLLKSARERMLDSERDVHLGRKASVVLPAPEVGGDGPTAAGHRRIGPSRKTISVTATAPSSPS
jgi:hypothetical protein